MPSFLKPKEKTNPIVSQEDSSGNGNTMDRRTFLANSLKIVAGALAATAAGNSIINSTANTEALKDRTAINIKSERKRWYELGMKLENRNAKSDLQRVVETLDTHGIYWTPAYPYEEVIPSQETDPLGRYIAESPPINRESYFNVLYTLKRLGHEANRYPEGFFNRFQVSWYVFLGGQIKDPRDGEILGLARMLPSRGPLFNVYNPIILLNLNSYRLDETGEFFSYLIHHEIFHGTEMVMTGWGPAFDHRNPTAKIDMHSHYDALIPIYRGWYQILPNTCVNYGGILRSNYDPGMLARHPCGFSNYASFYGQPGTMPPSESEDMATTFGYLMVGKEPKMMREGNEVLQRKVAFIKSLMYKWTNGAMDNKYWLGIAQN